MTATKTTEAPRNGPFSATPGMRLLGEILTWTCNGVAVKHSDLVNALKDADLDEGVARELAPRHAFTRACRKLARDRIIRQVGEDDKTLTFQFTQESRKEDKFEYVLETLLVLDKESGKVGCELPGLATLAQEKLDEAIVARTGGDVTRIVQKLFDRQADLFAIRPAGLLLRARDALLVHRQGATAPRQTERPVAPLPRPGGHQLPVVRRHADGSYDCGLMYDCRGAPKLAGLMATVFLSNLFLIPRTLDEFLELLKETFDNFEEVVAAGWRVD